MNTLGKRIKSRREELGYSQDELAKKLGYKSRSSINKIELDENDIPQSKIKAFADALDTSPSFLMGWEEEKPSTPPISLKEQRLLKSFNKLNALGQDKVIEYSEDLLSNYRYTVETIAAHNDYASDPEEQIKMRKDLDKL